MSKALRLSPKIKTLLYTLIGCIIYAFGLNAFIIPHQLLAGGVTGIALMVHYLIHWQPGLLNMLINIPILYAAYRWLGGWDVVITIFGAIAISYFVDIFAFLTTFEWTQNPIVGAITGGLVSGIGAGIMYRGGGNSGGLDPIAKIVNKYWGIQIASGVLAMNMLILFVSTMLFSIELAVITLINLFVASYVTNKIVIGLHQQKAAFIITNKPLQISHHIMAILHRGVTLLEGEGAYTGEEKQIIFTVVSLMQVTKLKSIVMHMDPNAFVFIVNANEVVGAGFSYKTPHAIIETLSLTKKNASALDEDTEDSL